MMSSSSSSSRSSTPDPDGPPALCRELLERNPALRSTIEVCSFGNIF